MGAGTRTFRLFVSSTFGDLKEERNALQAYVFPRLRDLCTEHGCRFQAIDLRWGVRDEAGLDQQTMKICLDEVSRSQRASPRPNFLVLLGDRYGWRPLPAEIPARDFTHIDNHTTDPAERQMLAAWYKRDDNACCRREAGAKPEAVYCLQPRGDRLVDFQAWENEVERPLRAILLRGLEGLDLSEDERRPYEASATEQEIAAGALKVPDARGHVFCFFRTIEGIPEDRSAGDFIDIGEHAALEPTAHRRLRELRHLLEDQLPGNVCRYDARWQGDRPSTGHIGSLPEQMEACRSLVGDPDAPHTLCVDVWKRLVPVIDAEIARLEQVEPLEREIADHRAFAEDRARFFVGRRRMLATVAAYLAGSDPHPLAVWGDSGSGKSALVAKAVADAAVRHADRALVPRFIGATPASSDGRSMLESVCRQITRIYGGDESTIPTGYRELAKEFGERLKLATAAKPLVVFLDAVDQLSDADHARNLNWLPPDLPGHVRLVISTLPSECKTALDGKLPPANLVYLEPMPEAEAGELLDGWLTEAGRTLQPSQRREVLTRFGSSATPPGARATSGEDRGGPSRGMPLYLKLAFDEARRWKSYTPPVRLAPTIPGIVRQLFDRLSSPANHGKMMVSRSLGYLAAARNGLSEDEMLDVLARDADVYASFLGAARHIPPDLLPHLTAYLREIGETGSPMTWLVATCVDAPIFATHVAQLLARAPALQLPVVLWSRLYFDLEPYLTERSADGASLLSFYHRQLREGAEAAFLADGANAARHAHLADYFAQQRLFEPQRRTPNVRKLSELPYQETHGEQWDELHETLTDVDFVEAKVRHVAVTTSGRGESARTIYGGVHEILEDFRRALEKMQPADATWTPGDGSTIGLRGELEEWSAFLVRHTQQVERCHNVLFGLCRLEGPPSMRRRCDDRLAAGPRAQPWIRAEPQWVPPGDEEAAERIEMLASLEFPMVAACALAPASGVAFVVAGLGCIGRVDLSRGRRLEPDITIRRERPLELACSADGHYLAVAFETGRIDVLEVQPEAEGVQQARLAWSARYRVPEYEPPALEFLDNELWGQAEAGDAVSWQAETGAERQRIAPPAGFPGAELAAVTRTRNASILAWRGSGGSRLARVADSETRLCTLQETSDIIALSSWGDDVAVSFGDRRLCIYSARTELELRRQLLLDLPAARLAERGSTLWWISTDGRLYLWRSQHADPRPVWTAGLSFVGARGLWLAPDDHGFILTPNVGAAFRAGGSSTPGAMFQAVAPRAGSYVALAATRRGYIVVDGAGRETSPVTPGQSHSTGARNDGREVNYLFAADGEGRLLVAHDGGSELRDVTTLDRRPCDLPAGTVCAAGRQTGGFWLADLQGRIFSLDREGHCRQAALVAREVLGPPRLAAWGSLVVWTGTRVATRATMAPDVVYFQTFFRAVNDRLEPVGEREYAAAEGLLRTVSWDEGRGRLIAIWQGRIHRQAVAKIGTPEAMIACREEERLLPGITGDCETAAMTVHSRRLFVLSADGAVRCFDSDTFAPVAALAGSVPFTGLAEGAPGEDDVMVIAGRQSVVRLHCEEGVHAWTSTS